MGNTLILLGKLGHCCRKEIYNRCNLSKIRLNSFFVVVQNSCLTILTVYRCILTNICRRFMLMYIHTPIHTVVHIVRLTVKGLHLFLAELYIPMSSEWLQLHQTLLTGLLMDYISNIFIICTWAVFVWPITRRHLSFKAD